MANPYGPFFDPEPYFKWLSQQEDIYSMGRHFPVLGWKPNDSAFEFFVYKALDGRDNVLHDEEIHKMFEKLRAKYGDIFIIDYYEAIVLIATWGDASRLGRILDRQRRTNKYNLALTEKQIELYTTYVIAIDNIR
jgi:hypothetical protein